MNSPFHEVDQNYKKKIRYIAVIACVSVIIMFLLYHMIPWVAQAWKIVAAVLKPVVLGSVICYLLYPAVTFFEKKFNKKSPKKWARSASVLLMLLIVLAALVVFNVILIWTATKQITKIDLQSMQTFLTEVQESTGDLSKNFDQWLKEQNIDYAAITQKIQGLVTSVVSGTVGAITSLFFGTIFSIYFLIDGDNIAGYWKKAAKAIIPDQTIRVLKELADDADRCFSGYIRGQAIDALIVGAVTTILMLLVGMPNAVLIGFLTGFGNLIPYVGPILGYGSVIIVTLLEFNPKMMVVGLIILIVVMFLDGNIINPRLLANAVNVHPLLVVAALLAGGALGGLLGILLAVPSGAFLKLQFDKFIKFRQENKKEKEVRKA